jgi:large subunit ribosomal protein L17
MRHGKKFNHLGRKKAHREAMLSNMATSLIMHKRIFTTVAKAKALRIYVEPLVTKAKNDSTHSRRTVFSYLQSKDAVKELFTTVADKVGDRPGGYTRILKTGNRLGDNAEMCMMELVDFNEMMLEEKAARTAKKGGGKKRTRRGKKSTEAAAAAPVTPVAEKVEDANADVVEAVEEVAADVAEATEEVVEKAEEVVEEVAEKVEETAEKVVEEVKGEEKEEEPKAEKKDDENEEDSSEEKKD